VITQEKPGEIQFFKWGLVPHFVSDYKIGNRLINARAETVSEKPFFRSAFKSHRCLVLADGFFEWDKNSKPAVPYYLRLKSGEPFAFAGICDHWGSPGQNGLSTFTIITTEPNSLVRKIHNRMPVILPESAENKWLDPKADPKAELGLLKALPASLMESWPVSRLVNNPRNNNPEVVLREKNRT